MAGSSVALSPNVVVTNATPSASRNTDGSYDKAKESVVTLSINQDLASAGIGAVRILVTPGASQLFTASAATWIVAGFGPTGGTLLKADGTAFAVGGLPAGGAHFRSVIAYCTDGVRVCNGSAWETMANAD